MAVKFYIVSVMFNAQNEALEYIDMLKRQSYQNFHCVLMDDMSTDQSVSVAKQAISDDRLVHDGVLQKPLNVYQEENALLTYGSHLNDR